MFQYPNINPVAFSLGPVQVYWYGMMYIFAFLAGWLLGLYRASKVGSGWTKEEVDDLVTWVMLGAILGGRLGYILFYDLQYYASAPLEIFYVWNGGMSFHGGLLGVLFSLWCWGRQQKKSYLDILDFIAPTVAPGLFFGRIGNFINGELWGRVTDSPLGMVFPHAGELPRHPTQLYEATLEGLVLFTAIWLFSSKDREQGSVAGLFAVLYGSFRIINECFREPDAHIGYLYNTDWLTMGMLLSLPLILAGLTLLIRAGKRKTNPTREKIVLDDGSIVWIKRS